MLGNLEITNIEEKSTKNEKIEITKETMLNFKKLIMDNLEKIGEDTTFEELQKIIEENCLLNKKYSFPLIQHNTNVNLQKRLDMVSRLYKTATDYLDNVNNQLQKLYFNIQASNDKKIIEKQTNIYNALIEKEIEIINKIIKLLPSELELGNIDITDIKKEKDEDNKKPDYENPHLQILKVLEKTEKPTVSTAIVLGLVASQVIHKVSSDTTKTGTEYPENKTQINVSEQRNLEYFTKIGALHVTGEEINNSHETHKQILEKNFEINTQELIPKISVLTYSLGTLAAHIDSISRKFTEYKNEVTLPEGYKKISIYIEYKKQMDKEKNNNDKENKTTSISNNEIDNKNDKKEKRKSLSKRLSKGASDFIKLLGKN